VRYRPLCVGMCEMDKRWIRGSRELSRGSLSQLLSQSSSWGVGSFVGKEVQELVQV
jgi:hypothetical protein